MINRIVEAVREGLYKNGCEVEFLPSETEKILSVINESSDALAEAIAEEKCAVIAKELRDEITLNVRQEFEELKGIEISNISPFISESVVVNGYKLSREEFIPHSFKSDHAYDGKQLMLNPKLRHWQLIFKTRGPEFVSAVEVIGCLIVAPSGPGGCFAYVVFIKGRSSPLVFYNGDLSDSNIIHELQLEEKALKNNYVAEAFRRSLSICRYVFFYFPPPHAGWNVTPDNKLTFVASEMDIPLLRGLFGDEKGQLRNVARDIILTPPVRTLENTVADYHRLLPDNLPIKIGTVISAMSRLLPHYKAEGLVQDRLWVVETSDNDTAKAMIVAIQNKEHRTTKALFSSEQITFIEDEITKYVDCAAVIRHSCAICSMHDFDKILKYLYELIQNGYADDDFKRLVPVLLIDNAGTIPEEFQIHQLSISDTLRIDNIEQAQRILGELDYHIVKFAERNPDAMAQRLKAAITEAKEKVSALPRRSQSSSAVMFIATALLLKVGGILTDADVQAILQWLRTEAKSRTSMGRSVCKRVGDTLSELICNGSLPIAKQYGPPFWTVGSAFVATDDSINITKDTLDDEILTDLSVGRNTALQYLKDEDALFTNKGEDQKTWTVESEDGVKKSRRFYSLSRDLLTPEANRIVDEAVASDLFHKSDEHIDNFFPFIKHRRLDMAAGQLITDYKHGNTFIDVTGSVGSGKTGWTMMQTIQRAKAGDVVVVLDPTNAFCREELSGHKIPEEIIDNHFIFWDMSTQGWPVNILDFEGCIDLEQKVQRLSSLLISGMHLTGPNQKAIVMTKAEEWLKEYEINSNLSIYNLPTIFNKNAEERKLKTKLDALLSTVKKTDNRVQPPGWDELLSERGKVLVISAGNATINGDANPFDIIFDTLYSFKDKNRDGRMTVVLDEVQTLNHRNDSTLVHILSRGRKLDISVILASQDYLNRSLAAVYKYCGTHILFRPLGEECIRAVAELTKLDINIIRTLPDFCCAIMGSAYSNYYKRNNQLGAAIIGTTYRPPYVDDYGDYDSGSVTADDIPDNYIGTLR